VTEPVITIRMSQLRKLQLCGKGSREFFQRHGLDWGDFLRNGVQSDVLEATGDAMAVQVVEACRGR
jgi:hypothetical protein